MLVNVNRQRDYVLDRVLTAIGQGSDSVAIQEGIYFCNHFSFGNQISDKHNDYPEFDDNYVYAPYGVCDDVQQVLDHYREWLEDTSRRFCISFTCVTKAEQPEQYGWRWHKWGTYIGTKEPKHEYLYEEDDSIEQVYCYHIYEIL